MAPSHPRIIFGGSTIGEAFDTPEAVSHLLQVLKSCGIDEIDTAALYPWTNIGMSETLLGQVGAGKLGFKIDTKILVMSQDANGTLEPAKIRDSINASIDRLQYQAGSKLNVVHCHAPDFTTPLTEQAAALDAMHKNGLFQQLGVSNFPLDVLTEFVEICDREGYVRPTVYQGSYSLISRGHEQLFPTLRKHGIIFNAHSPVATGFLSGKFTAGDSDGTRFGGDDKTAASLKAQYDKQELHGAIRTLNDILAPAGISNIEAALRWISYHSQLNANDGIIIGATKTNYIEQNMEFIQRGPLPLEIVTAIEQLWDVIAA